MKLAVNDVSLTIKRGETLGLVGESGSGKSTLALIAAGLLRPDSGSVELDGHDITRMRGSTFRRLRRTVQVVFQDPYAAHNSRDDCLSIVTEPLLVHTDMDARSREREGMRLLELVALGPGVRRSHPRELSGGQSQRVAIARALALRPSLIICDEPTSALDVSIQAQILNLLRDVQRATSTSYLFVSHDLGVIRFMSDRICVMEGGRLVEEGDAERLCTSPTDTYTQQLLASVPVLDPAVMRRLVANEAR